MRWRVPHAALDAWADRAQPFLFAPYSLFALQKQKDARKRRPLQRQEAGRGKPAVASRVPHLPTLQRVLLARCRVVYAREASSPDASKMVLLGLALLVALLHASSAQPPSPANPFLARPAPGPPAPAAEPAPAAPAAANGTAGPCDCSSDGRSGGVQSGIAGCQQLPGNPGPICYINVRCQGLGTCCWEPMAAPQPAPHPQATGAAAAPPLLQRCKQGLTT